MNKRSADLDRFWAKVAKSDECWTWTAAVTHSRSSDYGSFWFQGRLWPAHRWIYAQENGPIPAGMQVDHLCRNTLCVRPIHLEAVTGRTNILRSAAPSAANARKTHCAHGHPFDETNTVNRPCGRRGCRTCIVEARRRHAANT